MTPVALAGQFKHINFLSEIQMKNVLHLGVFAPPLACMAQGLSKVSVALLVLRFCERVVVWRRRLLNACIISTLLFTVLNVLLIWIQCIPLRTTRNAACLARKVQNGSAVFLGCKFSLQIFDKTESKGKEVGTF